VRIDGCDIFDDINDYGVKPRRSFSITSDLESKQDAESAAFYWISSQLLRFESKQEELTTLRQQNAELAEKLDSLLSSYGDNWYDGFMAAKRMVSKNTCPSDLSEQEVIEMSEIAEEGWLLQKTKREEADGDKWKS
jgi:hypothetical protein